jgi:hypothetical protein
MWWASSSRSVRISLSRCSVVGDVFALELDGGSLFLVGWASDWDAADCLCPLGDHVGTHFEVLVGLLQEQMEVAELRALDVPVVFVDLMIEDVSVGQVRVQRVDDLLGFVGFEPERFGFFDGAELLSDGFLRAHNIYLFTRHPLKD